MAVETDPIGWIDKYHRHSSGMTWSSDHDLIPYPGALFFHLIFMIHLFCDIFKICNKTSNLLIFLSLVIILFHYLPPQQFQQSLTWTASKQHCTPVVRGALYRTIKEMSAMFCFHFSFDLQIHFELKQWWMTINLYKMILYISSIRITFNV